MQLSESQSEDYGIKLKNYITKSRKRRCIAKIKKEEIIEANKILCQEFKQQGVVLNDANLDFAVDQFNEKEITVIDLARKIIQGHPFVEGNKRTAFVVYFYLNKVMNSRNSLVTMPLIGLDLVEYTKGMLKNYLWYGWLKLLSEV